MKQKLSLVTLGVADLAVSRTFYEKVLSLVPEKESSELVAFYDMGGTWLSLFDCEALAKDAGIEMQEKSFYPVTLAHNEPSREAIDVLFAELRTKGVTIIKEPTEVFWGGYSGYFSDPDGHLWEVTYNPFIDLT